MAIYTQICSSPLGPLHLVANDEYLMAVVFAANWKKTQHHWPELEKRSTPLLRATTRQLGEYFTGKRRQFELPLRLEGTNFQLKVWKGLLTIPYGETRSYQQQARALRSPSAVRAVGGANGKNPLCIVLPCHRIVRNDGQLGGYAGGPEAKHYLLSLEMKSLGRSLDPDC